MFAHELLICGHLLDLTVKIAFDVSVVCNVQRDDLIMLTSELPWSIKRILPPGMKANKSISTITNIAVHA
jgi:hypothetical protein